jgi:hypothetical protein
VGKGQELMSVLGQFGLLWARARTDVSAGTVWVVVCKGFPGTEVLVGTI